MNDDTIHLIKQLESFVISSRRQAATVQGGCLGAFFEGKASAYRLAAYWLRTDILKEDIILDSYLKEKKVDDTFEIEFECLKCGLIETADFDAEVTCCGEKMVELGDNQ